MEQNKIITIDDISSYFRKINFLKEEQEKLKEQAEREIVRIKSGWKVN